MQRPGREISPPPGAVPFGRDVARSEPGQGTMHRPGPGDGHRILRAPPLRCRALPADVVHRVESTARASGAVAPTEWGPLRTMSSTPGRWRASRCARRPSPVRSGVRTAGAAAGMVRAPSVPGAYRGARRARSGARCRRQEGSDRAEFLYHTAPCPPSGQSPRMCTMGPAHVWQVTRNGFEGGSGGYAPHPRPGGAHLPRQAMRSVRAPRMWCARQRPPGRAPSPPCAHQECGGRGGGAP